MGEIADEQNEANAKAMQHQNQAHAHAGRVRPWPDNRDPARQRPAENTERRE